MRRGIEMSLSVCNSFVITGQPPSPSGTTSRAFGRTFFASADGRELVVMVSAELNPKGFRLVFDRWDDKKYGQRTSLDECSIPKCMRPWMRVCANLWEEFLRDSSFIRDMIARDGKDLEEVAMGLMRKAFLSEGERWELACVPEQEFPVAFLFGILSDSKLLRVILQEVEALEQVRRTVRDAMQTSFRNVEVLPPVANSARATT